MRRQRCEAARVQAIVSPVGSDIGALTPEEIVLSVLAAIVKARRTGDVADATALGYASPDRAGETSEPQAERGTSAVAIDPVSGVSVAIGIVACRAGHAGMTCYFCCAQSRHRFEKKPSRYLEALREAQ